MDDLKVGWILKKEILLYIFDVMIDVYKTTLVDFEFQLVFFFIKTSRSLHQSRLINNCECKYFIHRELIWVQPCKYIHKDQETNKYKIYPNILYKEYIYNKSINTYQIPKHKLLIILRISLANIPPQARVGMWPDS